MGDSATAMRDPIFYRWHAYIEFIFQSFKSTLPRYSEAQVRPTIICFSIFVFVYVLFVVELPRSYCQKYFSRNIWRKTERSSDLLATV